MKSTNYILVHTLSYYSRGNISTHEKKKITVEIPWRKVKAASAGQVVHRVSYKQCFPDWTYCQKAKRCHLLSHRYLRAGQAETVSPAPCSLVKKRRWESALIVKGPHKN